MSNKPLKWIAVWHGNYPTEVKTITSTFFKGRGYSNEDIGKAASLEIGETLNLSDLSGFHTLTRIQ